MSLALKYRPSTFAEIAGQKLAAVPLYRMARLGTVPSALLLAGGFGCGKTSTARILGMALNCESGDRAADRWPCGECPPCLAVTAGNSLDVIEVDAASNGGVDAVRELTRLMSYGSPGRWKVLLLDEAHSMSRDAFNALLKIMEEPRGHTLFILLTTEPGKIPDTITSRCMTFAFRRISPAVIVQRLEHICRREGIEPGPGLLAEIASRSDGGMRDAVMLLDQAVSTLVSEPLTLESFEKVFGPGDCVLPLVQAMAAGDHPAARAALEEALEQAGEPSAVIGKLADLLSDLLVLKTSRGAIAAQGAALEAREALAARLDVSRLTRAMQVLWDYMTRITVPDRRAGLVLAAVLVTESLHPRPGPPLAAGGANGASGHGEASLDELKEALGAA